MEDFPKSKTIIIIFSVMFVIALGLIIPLSLMQKNIKEEIILNKNNFETYFNLELSYSQVNSSATIKYKIIPKNDCYENSETSQTINLTIAVKFYKNSSNVIKTEYIYVKLLKSKWLEVSNNKTINVPDTATRYEYFVSSVSGTIFI